MQRNSVYKLRTGDRKGVNVSQKLEVPNTANYSVDYQIGYGSNRKTRHLMPSGHKAFVVHNPNDVDLLLMHNKTFAAEYVFAPQNHLALDRNMEDTNSDQDFTRSLVKEESGYRGEGKTAGGKGHKCEGKGYNRIIDAILNHVIHTNRELTA